MRWLLVRTSALGDVAHALPVLHVLRRSFPEDPIAWAIDETFAPLLEGHPGLEEVIALPLRRARRQGARAWGDLARALRRLRAFRPDVALDLMGNHKGGFLVWWSGARHRVGPAAPWRRELGSELWINEAVAVHRRHAVDRNLDLLQPFLGSLESAVLGPDLLPDREERAEPQILLHPGAAWANKRYPPALWGQVAQGLREATGLAVRVIEAPGEEALAKAVVEAAAGSAELLEVPDLRSLVSVLKRAALVLGGDTGPVHLAQVLGRPVLILHGPTDPSRHGAYRDPQGSLALQLPCSFCHRRMDSPRPCLLALPPELVVNQALELLRRNEGFLEGLKAGGATIAGRS